MIWLKRIGLILLILFLGTILDYIVHQFSPDFAEQFFYYTHKVLYGTLWGLAGFVVLKKYLKTPFWVAFIIAATPAVLLQVWYLVKEHQELWVTVFFLFVHFFAFFLPGYFICKRYKHIFLTPPNSSFWS